MASLNEDTIYLVLSYIATLPPPQNAHQLARLARVSKDWHATATTLLYLEPAMMEVTYVYKLAQLRRTLTTKEELAEKVHTVNFSGQGRVAEGWSQPGRPPVEALEEMMRLCTSAQGVKLYGEYLGRFQHRRAYLSTSVQAARTSSCALTWTPSSAFALPSLHSPSPLSTQASSTSSAPA